MRSLKGQILRQKPNTVPGTVREPDGAARAPGRRAQHPQAASGVQVHENHVAAGGQRPPDLGDPARRPV